MDSVVSQIMYSELYFLQVLNLYSLIPEDFFQQKCLFCENVSSTALATGRARQQQLLSLLLRLTCCLNFNGIPIRRLNTGQIMEKEIKKHALPVGPSCAMLSSGHIQ